MANKLDIAQLKSLSPLNGLKTDNLRTILDKIELLEANRGQTLFKKGDTDKRTVYVLSGMIELKEGDEVVQTIAGGTDEARNPIAPRLPRHQTAVAAGDVKYISLDSELLDVTLTWDQTGIYEVGDFSTEQLKETGDWMAAFLHIKAFQKIPPANIQTIFMRLQQVNYKAGDIVIKQGNEGDYFYVISRGRCMVTRETPLKYEGINLAELGVGDTFGEEALLSEAKCNATITMQTDGVLMRLAKDDFQALLKEPMLEWLDHGEADKAVADGGQWLDVRLPSEFKAFHKDGAVNIPLYLLRHKLNMLDPGTQYVVCCDTGRRSSAAAFILKQKDFQIAVLTGGLNQGEL
ncbi:MAG: cyclic nucleotide-binding domain-containing protein [Gammaproteobacteria bacterium]|nr:cyclic nucleotide-binding domain-containing protein [Gammaproteobacteria bacterium]